MDTRRANTFPAVVLGKEAGLTLLEIMVTIVILSLGLLGLAGLQMTGLKNNRSAYYNSVAGQVAQDIAERLRVDQTTRNAITGATIKNLAADLTKCASGVADTFDNRIACLASALPGGRARVIERAAAPKALYVALTWTDLELNGANGWAADTTANPATTACGAASANVSCYYMIFRP